ncbi:TPA: hypothetical protein QDB40_003521 [Burkholderia vietnamiensis]|nr:hypothetical protein [Burkholderia vietnamiensis]
MDTITTIVRIFVAPLDGKTIALPPALDAIAHVLGGLLGGLFTASLGLMTLVYVAMLLKMLRNSLVSRLRA